MNLENNKVTLCGGMATDFEYDHEIYGEKYYKTYVCIERISGAVDVIPVIVSERLAKLTGKAGDRIYVAGQLRTRNEKRAGEKTRLRIFVFANEVSFAANDDSIPFLYPNNYNSLFLEGFLCKEPIHRMTPSGREITDLLLAVNRPYGKSDYIPCICWGRSARFASTLVVGDRCQISGRIQSRKYNKKLSDGKIEERMAYEVSINRIDYSGEFSDGGTVVEIKGGREL